MHRSLSTAVPDYLADFKAIEYFPLHCFPAPSLPEASYLTETKD